MTGFSWRDFQLWFDGFSENVEGAPSAKQWDRVKEQIARVDGGVTPPIAKPVMKPPQPEPAVPPTQEEFEAQTRHMLRGKGGPRDGGYDDKYVGASS